MDIERLKTHDDPGETICRDAAALIEKYKTELEIILNAPSEQDGSFRPRMVEWIKSRIRKALASE